MVSFQLLLSVLEYQTAVMRRDFETADRVLPTIPKEQRTRVAHFLEKQGFQAQALHVSSDPEHRFELGKSVFAFYTMPNIIGSVGMGQGCWKQGADPPLLLKFHQNCFKIGVFSLKSLFFEG